MTSLARACHLYKLSTSPAVTTYAELMQLSLTDIQLGCQAVCDRLSFLFTPKGLLTVDCFNRENVQFSRLFDVELSWQLTATRCNKNGWTCDLFEAIFRRAVTYADDTSLVVNIHPYVSDGEKAWEDYYELARTRM